MRQRHLSKMRAFCKSSEAVICSYCQRYSAPGNVMYIPFFSGCCGGCTRDVDVSLLLDLELTCFSGAVLIVGWFSKPGVLRRRGGRGGGAYLSKSQPGYH